MTETREWTVPKAKQKTWKIETPNGDVEATGTKVKVDKKDKTLTVFDGDRVVNYFAPGAYTDYTEQK